MSFNKEYIDFDGEIKLILNIIFLNIEFNNVICFFCFFLNINLYINVVFKFLELLFF